MAAPEPAELLERDEEVRALARMVNAARRGTGGVAVVEAPGGLGKTSLLGETRRRAEAISMSVLAARGLESEQEFAFGLVRRLLDPAVRTAEQGELFAGAARIAAPLLGAAATPDDQQYGDPTFPLLHGLYWLVAGLAERTPLLVIVDDVHWADRPSLRFLQFLAPRVADLPLLLALGWRPAEPGSALDDVSRAELLSHDGVALLHPGPLGPESVAEIVRSRLGEPADPQFCAACAQVTGGSPFLLGELLTELCDEGVPPVRAASDRVRELAPEAVGRAVLVRLARLGPEAAAAAEALAVLGDGQEPRLVAAQAGLDHEAATEALAALVRARILAHSRPLAFLHPLLRNAVYAQLDPIKREAAHARAAALLRSEGADAERVSVHLLHTQPGSDPEAVATLRVAASAAMGRGGPDAALRFLRRAKGEAAAVDGSALEADLFAAALAVGRADEMDAIDVQALVQDERFLMRQGPELALVLIRLGRSAQGLEVLERAAAAAPDADVALRFEADWLALASFDPIARQRALGRLRELLASPPAGRTPGERAMLTSIIGMGAELDLPYPQAAAMAEQAVAGGELLAERGPESFQLQSALLLLRETHHGQAVAAPIIESALEESRRRGLALGFLLSSLTRGSHAHVRGDLLSAEADVRASVEIAQQGGWVHAAPVLPAYLIHVLLDRGDRDAAVRVSEDAGWAEKVEDPAWATQVHLARARLQLEIGQPEQALRELRHAAPPDAEWPLDELAGRALAAVGRREEAIEVLERTLARVRQLETVLGEARVLRGLGRVVGGDAGVDMLRHAVALSETTPCRVGLAAAQLELGALLRRLRHRTAAREPLRLALQLAAETGAAPLADRARDELAASGERVRRPVASGVDELTPTEARIAAMAAEGMSNRDIAQALFVTVKNVEGNLTRAYRKLGIRGRAGLEAALGGRPLSAA